MIFSDSPQQRALERMMTAVPRFLPQGGGIMVLHRFEYTAEMCDCRYCPYYRGKRKFSILKDRFANLDELNYLAKRMESFDYHEYDQFLIGITKLQNPTEKDLINLTFNLDHFTLCKDVSSYGKIGREYVMNTQGAVPAHDEDDPKYAAIGKDLIDRGLAQITAKGLLIYNPFDELTEVYDGQAFPEYFYENTLASAEVSYNGRTELLLLPGEAIAIQKALARLGAPSDSDCEIKFCLNQGEDDAWEEPLDFISVCRYNIEEGGEHDDHRRFACQAGYDEISACGTSWNPPCYAERHL